MTNPIEPAEFFDADVDDLVGSGALVATDRLGGLERGKPVEAKAPENPTDGGGRDPDFGGNLLTRVAPPALSLDRRACGRHCFARR